MTSDGPFRVALLGHGTVGAAFDELLEERADAIEAEAGRRPEIVGVLTRSRGDFDDLLERSDLVVELMGGTDPAREYVLRALDAGRHVVTANKQLLSQFGEEIFDAARENEVQLRFEGAVAGVVPAIRVMARDARGRPHRARARHRERHHQLHPQRDGAHRRLLRGRPARGPGARLRGGRPDRGRDRQGRRGQDGDPRAAGLQRRRAPRRGELRGHRADHRGRHRLRQGARAVAQADRLGGAHRQRDRGARPPGVPLRGPPARLRERRLQRGHDRVAGHHGDHPLRPGRRRTADRVGGAGRRDLGDDPAAVAAAAGGGPSRS